MGGLRSIITRIGIKFLMILIREANGDENGHGCVCPNRARIQPVNNLVRQDVRNMPVSGGLAAINFEKALRASQVRAWVDLSWLENH
jgi:hypothetical protein